MQRRPLDLALGKYPPMPDPHSLKYLDEYPQFARLFRHGVHIVEVELMEPHLLKSLSELAKTLQTQFPHADEAFLIYPMGGIRIEGINLLASRPFYKK
jgi:hypothetical protein